MSPSPAGASKASTVPRVATNIQHMVFFAGMRGIVSYSCANIFNDHFGNRDTVLAMTTAICLITLFVQGGLTTGAISYLKIPIGVQQVNQVSCTEFLYLIYFLISVL